MWAVASIRRWVASTDDSKGRGGLIANIALARKLAELFWRLMVHGMSYLEQGLKKYEEKVAQTEQHLLQKLARKYNMVLQPKTA